ncbi:hypothetical protein C8J56DRAFT_567727 [Mycena floridula]|nr:hypothetical protein C8J56DRAFT_567727 [Mycena floridula]
MIGAMEKAKLVYILNRDATFNITISSPLEAHRNETVIYDMVAVDVGYDNPLFAVLEVDYSGNASGKNLVYHELDLESNHVVRKSSQPVNPVEAKTLSLTDLEPNKAAFSLAIVTFSTEPDEPYLVVGTGLHTIVSPRSCSSGFLRTYKFTEDGSLQFYHKTKVQDVPIVLAAFSRVFGVWHG